MGERVLNGFIIVVDPGEGGCADPVNGGAILGKKGTSSQRWEQGASVESGQGKG
jgi:N-acetylmuramoyl-L-alanine amidase